jgi:polyisoprenoid-binding protein YceI
MAHAIYKTTISKNKIKTTIMATTKWAIDATHSEVLFKVRHLMVSNVTGQFKQFTATVETDGDDMTTAKVNFTADLSSISTNNEQRDAHLRSTDFFDADNHPQVLFEGTKLEQAGGENYKLHGTLTMRGVSKPVAFDVEYGGIVKDPWGMTRTGFTVSGKVNRKDYGINFGMVSETGGIMLGEEVSISANAEFVKQPEA